jgi:cytoskeleton protein RodZ
MPEIGATLREARMRARIDVSEIEAQTKIRARYLRALENEEWDLLPGPTFIKSFLRTYATALGLDGKSLVEEYRRSYEAPGEHEIQPLSTSRRRPRGGAEGGPLPTGAGPSRGYVISVGLIGLLIVILVIGLLTRGSSPKKGDSTSANHHASSAQAGSERRTHARRNRSQGGASIAAEEVTVSLQATSTVWVCLQNGAHQKLIPGVDMQAGQRSGPFHAKRFEVTLGNASVNLTVNGKPVEIPASTNAIGYSIGPRGTAPLTAGREPTCA